MELKQQISFIQGLLNYSYIDFLVNLLFLLFLFLMVLIVKLILCIFFLHSAIDKFQKQSAYLEENGGRSDPVILSERKHVSLSRYLPISTVSIILYQYLQLQIPLLVNRINSFFLNCENLESFVALVFEQSAHNPCHMFTPCLIHALLFHIRTVHLHMQIHVPVDTHLSKHIANRKHRHDMKLLCYVKKCISVCNVILQSSTSPFWI